MEPSSLPYYYITCIWVLNVQKFINSFSIHPRSVSVACNSLSSMPEDREMKNSSVVAETMKLLANSSYGYQIMDRSRHTVTKYLNDEKTHSAINNKIFKRLNFITDQLYEIELVKSEIEH